MSDTPDLAAMLAAVNALVGRQSGLVTANVDLLTGTVDDPASFNSAGGKTGALGYYPVTLADGTVRYLPCWARIQAGSGSGGGGGGTSAPVLFDYDGASFTGALTAGERLPGHVFTSAMTLPAGCADSRAQVVSAPAASFALSLVRRRAGAETEIATITVSSGGAINLATKNNAAVQFQVDDVLTPAGPTPAVPSMTALAASIRLVQA